MTEPKLHFAVPITKATDGDNGSVFVEGLATTDDLDLDDQIIDKEFAFRGLTKWFTDWANIRQMHSPSMAPAGKAVEMQKRENGVWLKVKVVEPTAVRLVQEGVYRAFSVGIAQPRIGPHPMAKGGAVLDGIFSEVSLVDFPANPICRFDIAKRASATGDIEVVEKVFGEQGIQKRDFDSGVGGGTDRDKIPAEDFAGPNRSYPIVSPKDVHDAASLVGKADNPDAVKRRIIAIAHRKGPEFEAKLPESWKKGDSTEKAAKPDTKPEDDDTKPKGDDEDEKEPEAKKSFNKDDPDGDGDDDSQSDDDGDSEDDDDDDKAEKAGKPKKPFPPKKKGDDDKADDGEDEKDGGDDEKDEPISKSGLPYHLVRLHDALCPAYHEEDVLVAHPAVVKGIPGLISLEYFSDEVTKSLTPDGFAELPVKSRAYQDAVMAKNADGTDEAIEDLRKAFSEYYPNVGNLVPGSITPGQFHRGFLSSACSETPGGQTQGLGRSVEGKTPKPSQFQAGELHPGTSHKSAASQAIAGLHDYLSARCPEVCAVEQPGGMLASGPSAVPAVKQQDNGEDNKLTPVSNPERAVTKAVEANVLKAVDVEAMITKALENKAEELVATIDELTKRVKDLESMPDPATVAVRNASASGQLGHSEEAQDVSNSDEVHRLVRLVKAARSHDSNISVPAMEKLLNLAGPDGVSDLLK